MTTRQHATLHRVETVSPHSLEAERAVLGTLLVAPDRVVEVADELAPLDFFRAAHQRVYHTMLRLSEKGGFDAITVCEALREANDLDSCGGPAYVASLTDGTPRSTNLPHYAAIVRDHAHRRALIAVAREIEELARHSRDGAEAVLEAAEQRILAIGQRAVRSDFVLAPEWMRETFNQIDRLTRDRSAMTGVSTGFRDLDALTRGFQPGDLILVGARPSMGKTTFALQVALHVARRAMVGLFSVEMGRLALGFRAVSMESRIDGMRVMTGRLSGDDHQRIATVFSALSDSQLAVDDSPFLTPVQLRTKARRLKARHGLALLAIDYLQLLEPPQGKRRAENRNAEVEQLSRGLKGLAKELNVPVLVLSQLSRESERRDTKRPRLSDLRDSGSLEQDADVVLLLHRPEYYQPTAENLNKAELIVAKQRNGPTGTIELRFSRELTRFDDLSDRGDRP